MIKWEDAVCECRLEIKQIGTGEYGKGKYSYKFWHKDELIFEGDEYETHVKNEDHLVGELLSWLSLQEDDVDDEYWEQHDYGPKQFAFRDSTDCMDLKCIAMDLEES